ncbi:MAG: hypothetical protein FWG07_00450 [Treponema sp.]|nr:hypothetical protein [Treponema sp.]
MKRIFCILIVVFTITAAGFSQELKFSGYMNYGLGIVTTNDGDDTKSYLQSSGVDSEQYGGRFRLNGSYSNEDKTAGADFRIQLQGASVNSGAISGNSSYDLGLAYGYGWIRPIEMVQVKAGIVADSTFETAGPILRDDAGGGHGLGVFVKVTPIEGLNIGAGAYSKGIDGSNANNIVTDIGAITELHKAKYIFGAAYTMPEVFKFNISFRSFNSGLTQTGSSAPSRNRARLIGELQLLMMENLTAIVETELDYLWTDEDKFDEFSNNGRFNLFETFAYKMDDLRFGLNAAQYFNNRDTVSSSNKDKPEVGLRFNPWVSYALADGKIVPRLDAVYFLHGDRASTTDRYKYDRRYDVGPTYVKDAYIFNVRPSVKFFIDNRTSFEIGDVFMYSKADKDADAVKTNVVYVDLVVRF